MKVTQLDLNGLYLIEASPINDNRGLFERLFCQNELEVIRPNIIIRQINHSLTKQKGSIRGMHFQTPPHCEMKIIRCLKGKVFDVAIDLRKGSKTFLKWHAEILSDQNLKSIVIPEGFAHGFQTLEDNCELLYLHSAFYCKEAEGAINYADTRLNIAWPLEFTDISERDKNHPFISEDFEGMEITQS